MRYEMINFHGNNKISDVEEIKLIDCRFSLKLNYFLAESRILPKRVTAEYGSDLSLLCTFHNGDSDETVRFSYLRI